MKIKSLSKEYLSLIRRFPLAPIHNDQELEAAIVMVKNLTVPSTYNALTSAEIDYLDVLTELIHKYEQKHWKGLTSSMTPVESLQYLLEESGTTQSKLADIIGGRQSHISEFLTGKRDLSKENIIGIADYFKVSPQLFLSKSTAKA